MKRIKPLLAILTFMLGTLTAFAHYSVHRDSRAIITVGGKQTQAKAGMKVSATDMVDIPEGATLEIYNDLNKRIYTSIRSGKMSVTRLMIEAKSAAVNNKANVDSHLRFGKGSTRNDTRIYTEKGMVKRSMSVYDPEGDNVQMNSESLGLYIARKVRDGMVQDTIGKPALLTCERGDSIGMKFRVENVQQFPIYFNIMKIRNSGECHQAEISELGQPSGSYVLLPRQSISREHYSELDSSDTHLMIISDCQYDIDEVLDVINREFSDKTEKEVGLNLPVYLQIL